MAESKTPCRFRYWGALNPVVRPDYAHWEVLEDKSVLFRKSASATPDQIRCGEQHDELVKLSPAVYTINPCYDYEVRRINERAEAHSNYEQVTHPKHYCSHPSGVECIQVTEWMNFNLGNAIKYIWRASLKGKELQDLKKAVWYIQREIERVNGGRS